MVPTEPHMPQAERLMTEMPNRWPNDPLLYLVFWQNKFKRTICPDGLISWLLVRDVPSYGSSHVYYGFESCLHRT